MSTKTNIQYLYSKRIVRVITNILAVVILVVGLGLSALTFWDADLEVTNHKHIISGVDLNLKTAKTALGDVEYDMYGTTGPVILSVHGGFGGADQGRLFASWLQGRQVRILSPSRPGYLRTPLSSGATYEQQAKLLVALLDTLHIQKVTVVSYSAGGPIAYTLAAQYPDRIQSLVAIDSTSLYIPTDLSTSGLIKTSIGQKITKLSADWFTASFVDGTFREVATVSSLQRKRLVDYVMQSPERITFFKATVATLFPYGQREPGNNNDELQLRRTKNLNLSSIQVPSLIIHDEADADVPFYNGVNAYEKIPNAERYWLEGSGHFGFWLSPNSTEAQDAAWSFITKNWEM